MSLTMMKCRKPLLLAFLAVLSILVLQGLGALNLSPDASRLYVAFGPDPGGWIVAVDAGQARVATAFSSTAVDAEQQGGMWASGGPSVVLFMENLPVFEGNTMKFSTIPTI
jgi:hypothetical protein